MEGDPRDDRQRSDAANPTPGQAALDCRLTAAEDESLPELDHAAPPSAPAGLQAARAGLIGGQNGVRRLPMCFPRPLLASPQLKFPTAAGIQTRCLGSEGRSALALC